MHIDTNIEDIEYELNKQTYHDLLAHFVAVGTAIVQDPQATQRDRKSPLLYYDLASGNVAQLQTHPSPTH